MTERGLIPPGWHLRMQRIAARYQDPEALFREMSRVIRSIFDAPAIAFAFSTSEAETFQWIGLDLNGQANGEFSGQDQIAQDGNDPGINNGLGMNSLLNVNSRGGKIPHLNNLNGNSFHINGPIGANGIPQNSLDWLKRHEHFFRRAAESRKPLIANFGPEGGLDDGLEASGFNGGHDGEAVRKNVSSLRSNGGKEWSGEGGNQRGSERGGIESGMEEESISFLRRLGINSVCLLPRRTGPQRLGVLGVSSRQPDFFSSSRMRLLIPLAGQAALALDHALAAREWMRLEEKTERLELLTAMSRAIASGEDFSQITGGIFPRIRTLARIDAVALILPGDSGPGLHVRMLDFPGKNSRAANASSSLPEDSIAGRVFRSGKSWTGNPQALYAGSADITSGAVQFQSVCALPLIQAGRALGVLGLGRLTEEPFTFEETEFLEQAAAQIALALSRIPREQRGPALLSGPQLDPAIAGKTAPAPAGSRPGGEIEFTDVVGRSPALKKVLAHLRTVAPAPTTVLISGETGTGKELLAEAIHRLSAQRDGPFVQVNCAALPASLLESELFGHERGAFTGAHTQRIGRIELANQGTLFLDEIGELPLELQPKLLRVLQERQFERVGSSRPLRSTARILAATNRSLKSMVEERRFRADLYYRLSAFPLHLPPLRERREDIPLLVEHFVRHFSRLLQKPIRSIPPSVLEAFCRCDWPGNIRELQNAVERAVLLTKGSELEAHLADFESRPAEHDATLTESLEEIERRRILAALEASGWVLSGGHGAAAALGLKRSTLQFRMKKLGITRPEQD